MLLYIIVNTCLLLGVSAGLEKWYLFQVKIQSNKYRDSDSA